MNEREQLAARMRDACEPLSVADLARLAQCSDDTIRRYLGGRTTPTPAFLRLLCNECGTSAEWLLCGSGPKQRSDCGLETAKRLDLSELLMLVGARLQVGTALTQIEESLHRVTASSTRGREEQGFGIAARNR